MPSQTSSIASRSRGRDALVRGVDVLGAVGEQDAVEAVEPTVRWRRCRRRSTSRTGSWPARRRPASASARAARVGRHPVAAEELFNAARRRRSRARWRPRRRPRPCSPATAAARSASRLRASALMPQWPGTTLPEVPPSITPTLAVVSASSRPSSMRAIAAAAAAIALLPSSGSIPGVGLDPDEVGADLLLGRRGDDHLADRAGVVEDEAAIGAQLACDRRPSPRAGPAPRRRSAAARSRPAVAPSAWRATSSMKTATAALLSAPRIVSPRLRKTPSSSTTSI